MSDDSLPGSDDPDVQQFARAAFVMGEGLALMRAAGVPDQLACDCVYAWYASTLEDDVVFVDLADGDDD